MHRRFVYVTAVAIVLGCGDEPVGVERSPEVASRAQVASGNLAAGTTLEETDPRSEGKRHLFRGTVIEGEAPQPTGSAVFTDEDELILNETGSESSDHTLLVLGNPCCDPDWAWAVNSSGVVFLSSPTAADAVQFRTTATGTKTDVDELATSGDVTVGGELEVTDLTVTGLSTEVCIDAAGASKIGRCASSIRYKEDIRELDRGLETIQRLRPVTFRWNTEPPNGRNDFGFIAEDVAALDSLLATYDETGLAQGVKYRQMTALLAKGIQELSETVERQREEIEVLKQLVADLVRDAADSRIDAQLGGAR